MKKILLYYNTIKYLKFIQVYYRGYYLIRRKWRNVIGYKYDWDRKGEYNKHISELIPSIQLMNSYKDNQFDFLNISHEFQSEIDWNYNQHGKLWTYNLNYFDFLNQEKITKEDGLDLIHDFISHIEYIQDGLEPFPISLRLMNWIKFIVFFDIKDDTILENLFVQSTILEDNLEYHLLGNHLLENLFALVATSVFYGNQSKFNKYSNQLIEQLEEQILDDGAHYELSPMYHQIMLFRLLDTINIIQHTSIDTNDLIDYLTQKAALMLGWINEVTFNNGDIPLFNDAANNITPSTSKLNEYAKRLGIEKQQISLSSSGYRKFITPEKEIIFDVGNIGPDYIPGHAHSDTFSFVMNYEKNPFIVDTGLSTYELGEIRNTERSTSSHNTVMINNIEQSQIWGGFRVAHRAKVELLTDTPSQVIASHDGYKRMNVYHQRTFNLDNNSFVISDTIKSRKAINSVAFLHFHPDVSIKMEENICISNLGKIIIEGSDRILIEPYSFAPEFNKRIPSKKLRIEFKNELKLTIK